MSEETLNAGETTEQLETGAEEQSQQAVNGTEEATVQEGDETESQSTKTPAWVEKRFAEMTRSRHEAERRAEALQRDLDHALALAKAGGTDAPQAPAATAPVNEDERINQRAAQLVEEQSFNKRSNDVYAAGIAEHPDFDESLKNLGMLGASPEFFKSIVDLEDAHKVLHALGSNPDEAARILALPPLKQGRELERLASKPAPAKGKKPVSNAPEPISSRVGGSGSRAVDLENSSIDDFMKARNSLPRRR
jgi:hypothetical protein